MFWTMPKKFQRKPNIYKLIPPADILWSKTLYMDAELLTICRTCRNTWNNQWQRSLTETDANAEETQNLQRDKLESTTPSAAKLSATGVSTTLLRSRDGTGFTFSSFGFQVQHTVFHQQPGLQNHGSSTIHGSHIEGRWAITEQFIAHLVIGVREVRERLWNQSVKTIWDKCRRRAFP